MGFPEGRGHDSLICISPSYASGFMQSLWKMNCRYFYLSHCNTELQQCLCLGSSQTGHSQPFHRVQTCGPGPVFSLCQKTVTWSILQGDKGLGNFSWTSNVAQGIHTMTLVLRTEQLQQQDVHEGGSWRSQTFWPLLVLSGPQNVQEGACPITIAPSYSWG